MTEQSNGWDLGGGGDAFPFDTMGDEIEGYVVDLVERQSSDMDSGEPAFWDEAKTQPKMLSVVTLATSLRENPQDTGHRTVALSGSRKPDPAGNKSRMAAVLAAVRQATGGSQLQPNALLKIKFTSEGIPTRRGWNAPKYFEAWYTAPPMDLNGSTQQPPAQQQRDPWSTSSGPGPEWAQSNTAPGTPGAEGHGNPLKQGAQNTETTANPNHAGPVPKAAVEGLKAMQMDPALVYGPDWEARVVA